MRLINLDGEDRLVAIAKVAEREAAEDGDELDPQAALPEEVN